MKNKKLPLVNIEQAKKLSQFGFISTDQEWECEFVYNLKLIKRKSLPDIPAGTLMPHITSTGDNFVPAPTVALALKWLRDEKYILVTPRPKFQVYDSSGLTYPKMISIAPVIGEDGKTYEEAESAGLNEALNFLKKVS